MISHALINSIILQDYNFVIIYPWMASSPVVVNDHRNEGGLNKCIWRSHTWYPHYDHAVLTFLEDHFLITIPWLGFDPSPGSVNVAVPLTRDPLIDWYRSCVPHNNNNTISSISIDRCSSLLDRRIRSALASGRRLSSVVCGWRWWLLCCEAPPSSSAAHKDNLYF